MEIFPIGSTKIQFPAFLLAAKNALGRSVSVAGDAAGLSGSAAFLTALGAMKDDTLKASQILRDAGSLLRHLYYSFIILADRETVFELIQETRLSVTSVESLSRGVRFGIVSGTLEEWRTAIINCCSLTCEPELRAFLSKVFPFFERDGLGLLWSEYLKRTHTDGTLLLEWK